MKKIASVLILLMVMAISVEGQNRRMPEVKKRHVSEIRLSDPAVLADPATKMYYMTGTGGMLYTSTDLKYWTGPYFVAMTDSSSWMGPRPMIWAAELHQYKGKYYYLSFGSKKF